MSAGYLLPSSLAEAVALAGPPILAGGTLALPEAARRGAAAVLDLTSIAELRRIDADSRRVRIGAGVAWASLADHPALAGGLLAEVAAGVGTPALRRRATFVGNLCSGLPGADGPPAALALDATAEIVSSRGTRTVPLPALLAGEPAPDEIVVAVVVRRGRRRHRWQRVAGRAAMAPAVVSLAVVESDHGWAVAVGGACPAVRRPAAEERTGDAAAFADAIVADLVLYDTPSAPAPWRAHVLGVLARRAHESLAATAS